MQRLLQGDVGSGKTVVAAIACLAAIQSAHQAAFMAQQRYWLASTMKKYLLN